MIKLRVELGRNSYEIRIGSGLLSRIGGWLKERGYSGKVIIITDSNVRPLYADILQQGVISAGFSVNVLEVPAGEEQKTLATAGQLYQSLAENFAELVLKTAAMSPNPYLEILTQKIYSVSHEDSKAAKRPIKSKRPIKVKPEKCSLFILKRPINLRLN
jgi:3-dehydroquinate synthetase